MCFPGDHLEQQLLCRAVAGSVLERSQRRPAGWFQITQFQPGPPQLQLQPGWVGGAQLR
jgi:hypothetical protein